MNYTENDRYIFLLKLKDDDPRIKRVTYTLYGVI